MRDRPHAPRAFVAAHAPRAFVAQAWHGGALTYAQPTTTLAARCRGSTLAVHHPDDKIGGTAWIFSQTFTRLATSNVGGVGFLEQTIPDT